MARAKGLNVGEGVVLPLDAITQSFALLAVRRAGKSNAAAVMAEEMHDAALPWVAVDPKGDWWGLRSSADGTGPGLPIPIFGGLHGDLPLVPEAGSLMAGLVVEHNLTCVLDVSRFSKAGRIRFLTAFGERLYELHQADPQPRHVFLEEADRIAPQKVTADMAACVGAWSDLVRLGGAFGLGATIISQRSAVINKDLLTQVEVMVALRTTSPQDRKAIRDWMEHQAIAAEVVDSLPGLASGEAWISSSDWLPRHGQPKLQRIRFRQRRTFDSGATPVVGQRRRPAATIADIDLGAMQERMTAVVEQAAANDPAVLRRRITQLERAVTSAKPAPDPAAGRLAGENERLRAELAQALIDLQTARAAARVEVPVLRPGDIAAVEQAIEAMRDTAGSLEIALSRAARPAAEPAAPARPAPRPAPERIPAPRDAWPRTVPDPVDPSGMASLPAPDAPVLSRAQRAILTVLAQHPDGRSRQQTALLSGYSAKSSSFANALGALRTAALIDRGEPIRALDAGVAALGGQWEPLPAAQALVDYWLGRLGRAEAAILRALLSSWPEPLTKEDISAASGYSLTSSSFANALGRLRSLELAIGYGDIVADETLGTALHAGSTR